MSPFVYIHIYTNIYKQGKWTCCKNNLPNSFKFAVKSFFFKASKYFSSGRVYFSSSPLVQAIFMSFLQVRGIHTIYIMAIWKVAIYTCMNGVISPRLEYLLSEYGSIVSYVILFNNNFTSLDLTSLLYILLLHFLAESW